MFQHPALTVINGVNVQVETCQIQHFKKQLVRHEHLQRLENNMALKEVAPNIQLLSNLKSRDGNFTGILRIPTTRISVPIYLVHGYWENYSSIAQAYVDRQYSAALMVSLSPNGTMPDLGTRRFIYGFFIQVDLKVANS